MSIDFDQIEWDDVPAEDTPAADTINPVEIPEGIEPPNLFGEEDEDEYQSVDEPTNLIDVIDSADDDDFFHFGEDVKLTKKEIRELAQAKADIAQREAFITETSASLERIRVHQDAILERSKSETERAIDYYQTLLNDPSLSDADRGKFSRALLDQQKKYQLIDNDAQALIQSREAEAANALKKRVADTDDAMSKRYGREWANSANDVYGFAIGEYGISGDDIAKALCPGLAQALIDARKYRMMEAKAKEKSRNEVKALVARSTSKNSRASSTETSGRKDAFVKKLSNGTASTKDVRNAFDLIEW